MSERLQSDPATIRAAMGGYEILPDFEQDSPEWHQARRQGIGASEVAAVLGLSPWQTPLSVYRTKMGVPNEIPENLAYFGHALEEPIAQWIRDKHPEVGLVSPGLSARSTRWPWLTASPDRIAYVPLDGDQPPFDYIPVELKTSSAYGIDKWADGVPLFYATQVQTQLAVLDAPYGWLAVLHGGNTPELYRIERDNDFIHDHLIPKTKQFWEEHVLAQFPPEPTTVGELPDSEPGSVIEGSETVLEAIERRAVLLSDVQAQKAEADALTLVIGKYMGDAETITINDRPVLTFKTQQGRRTVDIKELTARAPELATDLIKQSAPYRVMRTVKEKS
jgi:putative phage-type endonuclease